MPQPLTDLLTEFLFDISIELEPAQDVGPGPFGRRMILILKGGSFDGPRVRGTVLPGGGDWVLVLANGALELDIRATLRTHDGALIFARLGGVLDAAPAVFARGISGQDVDAAEYYLRATPRFETGSDAYAWLNKLVCIGTGAFGEHQVAFRMFAVR